METKAHHVLIGAFTLVVIALVIAFALWLGKTSLSKQHHNYEIVFTEAVTGLSKGSPVQYNGIQVGEVTRLKLDRKDPRKVLAQIQVAADTPIRADTRAKVAMTSLTGPVIIQLTGGSPDSPPLMPTRGDPVPSIKSENSALSELLASGSNLMTTLNGILDHLGQLVSQQNVARLNRTLKNLSQSTSTLAAEGGDLQTLIQQTASASKQLNQTLSGVNKLVSGPGQQTFASARKAMASLAQTTATLNRLLVDNQGSLQSGLRGMRQIGPTLRDLRRTLGDVHQITNKLESNPAGFLLGRQQATQFTPKRKPPGMQP
jgi:phospholipid/cholesterol/gamma-HCH transport system substrate-binding protein